jgi:uncharacterized protein YvpB
MKGISIRFTEPTVAWIPAMRSKRRPTEWSDEERIEGETMNGFFTGRVLAAAAAVLLCIGNTAFADKTISGITHIHQERDLCVPTSAAMVLSYYGHPQEPRVLKLWSLGLEPNQQEFIYFSITLFTNLITGLQRHGIYWTQHNYGMTTDGYQSGLQQIEAEIDQGRPVLVDTSLHDGHTMVVIGYSQDKIILVDPLLPAPGVRHMPLMKFFAVWNSKGSTRAAIFTR